jgi:hypothetical protein
MKRLLHILMLVFFLVPILLGTVPVAPAASAQNECLSSDMGPCTCMGPGKCSPREGDHRQSSSPSDSSSTDSIPPCTVCLLAYNLTSFLAVQTSWISIPHVESISLPMPIKMVSLVTPPEERPPRFV